MTNATSLHRDVTDSITLIHQAIEIHALQAPDSIAVSCSGSHLTYKELNERANQLANYLRRLGVRPTQPVALCLDRSLDILIAIVGVLKAGGTYVPLDLAYPKARLQFMLADTHGPVIITQEGLLNSLPEHQAEVICIDSHWDSISRESVENPESQANGEDPAYIIFTSGSTGQPKGVLVSHHNVIRLFSKTDHWFGFGPEDVWTLFHSYAFDFSVWEIWGALLYGGRLVVVPYLVSRSPEQFSELLVTEGVTVLNQTPSAFRQLMWAESAAQKPRELQLRYVVFGGEALELQSLRPWFDLHGDEQPLLVNMYGITETTVHVTYRPIRRADLDKGLRSVIGVPIPDLQLHLLGEDLKPVPTGSPGEIFVGGAGVVKGYLNRPELNAMRFIPDPFSNTPGARLYRSGDLAQYTKEGELEYLGRADQQIKIRGFRIELGEIESALNQHPAVKESAVVAADGCGLDKRLVGYVVRGDQNISITDLRSYLEERIPDYMIPAAFVFLPALPLTPNGKLDRRALPAPDRARPVTDTAFVAPRAGIEQTLARIWSEVLEIEPIGIHDNFFELGGDSIRSIQVLARAQSHGLHLSLEQLFQEQTIDKLVNSLGSTLRLSDSQAATEPFSLLSASDRERLPHGLEDAYPTLMLQAGMFFHNDLNPASAIFHDVFSFRIQFPFDRDTLEQALAQLVSRHPVMRTSFDLVHFSEPLQLVHPNARVPLTVDDLRKLTPLEQTQALDAYINTEKHRPLDRTQAPLMRAAVQLYNEEEFQLIVSFHHAILDGWSLAAFLTELLQDYSALIKGTGNRVAPPRIAYREYVALERNAIDSQACRQFWTKVVQDAPMQKLPRWPKSMRERGTEQKRGPEVQISAKVFDRLKKVAQSAGVPLKSVLQAAHFRVMSLLHGTPDTVSGLVTNGRPESLDGERLIGLSLNTVPVRLRLEGGSWLDLIRKMFEAECELLPYRRFPLIEIQKLAGGQALFETAFDFVHFHVYKNLQGYQDMGFLEGHYAEANSFTLFTTFMLDVTTTQLQMHCDYDPNELCPEQIDRICGYYVKTLEAMATEPGARYETFSPLSAAEHRELLVEWNEPEIHAAGPKTIAQFLEAQVERTPDAVALIDGSRTLTYRELNQHANRLARHLVGLGGGPEVLIGICVDRSASMIIALLGILKAGGAYVPLDPTYPSDRLAFILSDTNAPILLSQKHLISSLPEHSARVVWLDEPLPEYNAENLESRASGGNLAYIIYTSGSTGKPKGVAIEHRNTAALLNWARTIYGSDELAGVLASTSICFDLSVFEIFVTLSWGGKVILCENALQLPELPAATDVTLINTVPSAIAELLRQNGIPTSVRTINLAGKPLQTALVSQLYENTAATKVYDLYGPSEDTTYSTFALRQPNEPATIGKPLSGKQVYLLDSFQQPLPTGVTGEIYIGGAGVARGYLNRPELTAQKFVFDPFAPRPGARLYRTGDLARYRLDGNLEFLGRLDHQVKIRGFRIELGEIESVLSNHSQISGVAVLAIDGVQGQKQLVAYLAVKSNAPTIAELRAHIKQKLPDYMVPSSFIFLPELPLTANGKIDRKALLAMKRDSLRSEDSYTAPRTPTELALTEIWQDILNVPRVGIHDNFFELGGHSLLATRVVSRIRQVFDQEVSLRELFQQATVAALASNIDRTVNACAQEFRNAPIKPRLHGERVPLSYAQQRLWFLDQLEPGNVAYILQQGLRLTGPLQVHVLERCLNEIVRRHESLRTVFPDHEGRPYQKLLPAVPVPLEHLNLQSLPEAEREAEAQRVAIEDSQASINLQQGPMFRASLLQLGEESHILLLTTHHISSDGWSWGVLLNELSTLYKAYLTGAASPLPELPIQYADFAIWQREWLADGIMDDQLEYWKNALTNHPPISTFPTDAPRPATQSYKGARLSFTLKQPLVNAIKQLCQKEGCTLYMGLLAAFDALLFRHSGQADLLIGTPIANRNRAETEALIGCFINTLVLRTDLSGEPSFRTLLERVCNVTLDAYSNQDLPFSKLVEELHPVRNQSYSPLFQVMFILQNTPHAETSAGGVSFKPFDVDNGTTKYDLTLELTETDGGLSGRAEYASELFDAETIQKLLDEWEDLLTSFVADPDQKIQAQTNGITVAPSLSLTSTGRAGGAEAPKTPEEVLLARIWCEVLGLGQVSVNENFFELGGHSLLAIQIISRTRSLGYGGVSVKDLFAFPTVATLAKRLQELKETRNGATQPPALAALGRRRSGANGVTAIDGAGR